MREFLLSFLVSRHNFSLIAFIVFVDFDNYISLIHCLFGREVYYQKLFSCFKKRAKLDFRSTIYVFFRFGSASSLLAAAKEKFPVFKKLEEIEKPPVIDGDNEAENQDEEKISLVEQFRRIFFMPLVPELEVEEEDEHQSPEVSEFLKQKHLVKFLEDAVQFASIFEHALPVVCTLLGSKQVTQPKCIQINSGDLNNQSVL